MRNSNMCMYLIFSKNIKKNILSPRQFTQSTTSTELSQSSLFPTLLNSSSPAAIKTNVHKDSLEATATSAVAAHDLDDDADNGDDDDYGDGDNKENTECLNESPSDRTCR